MNYIILGQFGRSSIRAISALMQEDHRVLVGNRVRLKRFQPADVIIRWANNIPIKQNGATIINKAVGIKNASNKAEARRIFQENNIRCPKTWFPPYNYPQQIIYPCILRKEFHRKGQDFTIIDTHEWFDHYQPFPETYISQLIDKTNEYRVHVGHGKVLLIHEKPLQEGEIRANQAITGLSWGKALNWSEYRRPLCKLACDAVKVLGLDTGAVDIIKGRDRQYYVLEVNTAPTLNDSPYSCQRYALYFDWLLRHPKAVWWDYSKWEAGESYAWKNNQLEE